MLEWDHEDKKTLVELQSRGSMIIYNSKQEFIYSTSEYRLFKCIKEMSGKIEALHEESKAL